MLLGVGWGSWICAHTMSEGGKKKGLNERGIRSKNDLWNRVV